MRNRWSVLAALFVVRTTMGVQFQSVATVAPLLSPDFGVDLADIGVLVGLYSAPGVALALPGGAIGQRFGDKNTVLVGLVLMIVGSLMMTFSSSWGGQVSGRLVAGIGGVLINVLMAKMVTDWFTGKEISTAMAIFVNSWPVGIAIALVALPPIAMAYGPSGTYVAVAVLIAVALGLLAGLYSAPAASTRAGVTNGRLGFHVAMAVFCAGLIWGLLNMGFSTIFGFGPSMLVERGWSITAAGSAISIVLWLTVPTATIGGLLADRTGRHSIVMLSCFFVFAMLMVLASRAEATIVIIIALGMSCGLATGPILSLPARVLEPETRAIGMGLFYTFTYLGLVLGPVLGGKYATWAGNAGAAFDFGAVALLICPVILWIFHGFENRAKLHPQSAS